MFQREKIIELFFESWLNNNILNFKKAFASEAIYSECYGPEYHGIETIASWFEDWNLRGSVLNWDIKQFIHQGSMTTVEWYFKCEYDRKIGEFNGVSLIEFNDNNYIVSVKEFQSKVPHYYPYE